MLPSVLGTIYNFNWLKVLSRAFIIVAFVIGMYFNIVYIYNNFSNTTIDNIFPNYK